MALAVCARAVIYQYWNKKICIFNNADFFYAEIVHGEVIKISAHWQISDN